jgi:hypothetical protein
VDTLYLALPHYKSSVSLQIAKQLVIDFYRMDKDQVNRIIEGLQSDLKTLILETRKKYTSVKEVN